MQHIENKQARTVQRPARTPFLLPLQAPFSPCPHAYFFSCSVSECPSSVDFSPFIFPLFPSPSISSQFEDLVSNTLSLTASFSPFPLFPPFYYPLFLFCEDLSQPVYLTVRDKSQTCIYGRASQSCYNGCRNTLLQLALLLFNVSIGARNFERLTSGRCQHAFHRLLQPVGSHIDVSWPSAALLC